MIVFLYGKDGYRIGENERELVEAFRAKHGNVDRDRFDLAEKGSLLLLEEFLTTQSMFSPKKLVVLKNIDEASDEKKMQTLLKTSLEDTDSVIIIVSEKKPKAKFSFLLKEPVKSKEFEELTGEKLYTAIEREAKKRNISLLKKDIRTLASLYGTDMWGIVTELEKMSFSGNVSVEERVQSNFFFLTQRLKGGRTVAERMVALERLMSEQKEDAGRVFNSLAFKLSNGRQARQYADYDVAVKSGKSDYEEVLLSIALTL